MDEARNGIPRERRERVVRDREAGGYMLGLKALSDPACTHNFIVLSDSSTCAGTRAPSSQGGGHVAMCLAADCADSAVIQEKHE